MYDAAGCLVSALCHHALLHDHAESEIVEDIEAAEFAQRLQELRKQNTR